MAFMLPTGLLYYLVKDLLGGDMGGKAVFYTVGCVICFALILITTWFQYNNTFFTTYEESGKRRLSLAERLRKLPLSFFGKKDLADLTSTIMADCEVLEKDCSHYIPALFGSVIAINAYMYLIRNVSPALATSYAYVNPVVAVLLGTGLGGETLSKIEWLALGVIVFAVVLVTLGKYLFPAKPVVAPVIQDASSE